MIIERLEIKGNRDQIMAFVLSEGKSTEESHFEDIRPIFVKFCTKFLFLFFLIKSHFFSLKIYCLQAKRKVQCVNWLILA